MSRPPAIQILPYSRVVGQESLKRALELAYIAPRIGGVLISGQRGTGKSTAVRAFSQMMYGRVPVTLPINATEDRVVGGWKIEALMRGKPVEQRGLLEEADGSLLYVDEVNLLDDHIVNIILDVTSTGVLVVQREGRREQKPVSFTLVGTMNPEEGGLRPQLHDRFGLCVAVRAEEDRDKRARILQTVLAFDEAMHLRASEEPTAFLTGAMREDEERRALLETARRNLYRVSVSEKITGGCVAVAAAFGAEGHRGDYVMALAARAYAALDAARSGREENLVVTGEHVRQVAPLALQHRREEVGQGGQAVWTVADDERVVDLLKES